MQRIYWYRNFRQIQCLIAKILRYSLLRLEFLRYFWNVLLQLVLEEVDPIVVNLVIHVAIEFPTLVTSRHTNAGQIFRKRCAKAARCATVIRC